MTKEERQAEDGGPVKDDVVRGVTRGLALINARFRVVEAAKDWRDELRSYNSGASAAELFAAIDALRELEKEQVK